VSPAYISWEQYLANEHRLRPEVWTHFVK
jgi:hypothetical protein